MSLDAMLSIAPYDWHAIAATLFSGALIGLERQLRGKPVGIRTATLITMGTYLFMSSSITLTAGNAVVDPSRIIGQVITGIGFLGAGVMLARDGAIVGVTSAATIWMLAAIGVIISMGYIAVSMKMTILTVMILYGLDIIEGRVKALSRGVHARYVNRRNTPRELP